MKEQNDNKRSLFIASFLIIIKRNTKGELVTHNYYSFKTFLSF